MLPPTKVSRYSGKSEADQTLATRQISYVTDSSDKLFLSLEACEGLGMASPKFPKFGEVQTSAHVIGDNTGEENITTTVLVISTIILLLVAL